MESDLTPEAIREAEFRTALRGADRAQVAAFLQQVADAFDSLANERDRLVARFEEGGGRDLESEFESVGREVSVILQSARDAAEAMRERASLDAVTWRAQAREEGETNRKQAGADAEALRRDAWAMGTELLDQAMAEARRLREEAERDVLTVMGEAEREAHRLTSGARREAEDLVRNASMDAEKMAVESTMQRDEIIERANRQAAAAQERTRALEHRREELLEELENVRSTLSRLEGSLEERREGLQSTPQESSTVRVLPPSSQPVDTANWDAGETVRVVPSDVGETEDHDEAQRIAEAVSADLARIREEDAPSPLEAEHLPPPAGEAEPEQPEHEPRPPEPVEERGHPEPALEPETVIVSDEPAGPTAESEAPVSGDEVTALFRSLRTGGTGDTSTKEEGPSSEGQQAQEEKAGEEGQVAEEDTTDWIDERDARLLPITNRALRGVKKAVTELQNIALDGLRTDEDWRPDAGEIAEAMRGELITVWSESFAAGHAAAETSSGKKLKRPPTPHTNAADEFAAGVAEAVSAALEESGGGQRERQSAASRVYRVWRTDEGERRIRELGIEAYELGVEHSLPARTGAET